MERVPSGAANPVLVSRYPPGILEAPDVSHRFRSASFQIGHWGSSRRAFTIPSGPRPASRLVASRLPAFPNMLISPLTLVARWVRWPKGITLNPSRVARGSTQAAMRRTAAERLSPSACERVLCDHGSNLATCENSTDGCAGRAGWDGPAPLHDAAGVASLLDVAAVVVDRFRRPRAPARR